MKKGRNRGPRIDKITVWKYAVIDIPGRPENIPRICVFKSKGHIEDDIKSTKKIEQELKYEINTSVILQHSFHLLYLNFQ